MVSSVNTSGDSPERREATDCFMKARAALKNGEVNTAEKLLRHALKLWPDNYNYTLQLAKLAIQVGKNEIEIEELLRKSSILNLMATEPRLLMATQYEKHGQTYRALSIYKGVLNIDPSNIIVRRKLGQYNIDLGSSISLDSLEIKVLKAEPKSDVEKPTAPVAAAPPKPFTAPTPVLTTPPVLSAPAAPVISTMPTDNPPNEAEAGANNFSETLQYSQEYLHNQAQQNLGTATAVNASIPTSNAEILPQEVEQEIGLAVTQTEDNWESLIEAIQHDSQMFEIDGQLPLNVGISYMEMGLHEEAVEEFQEAYKIFVRKGEEDSLRCCRLAIDCLIPLGRYQDAAQWCEQALELCNRDKDESQEFIQQLSELYDRMGDPDRAAQLRSELRETQAIMPETLPTQFDQTSISLQYALRPLRGVEDEQEIPIDMKKSELVIGRGHNNDINIDSPRVSKQHAQLKLTPQGIIIISLSQTNGTLINGEKLEFGYEYSIQIGDRIGLGKTVELELIQLS